MVRWILSAIFILGIVAGDFGFSGVAGTATWIVQVMFFLFVIAFIIGLFWSRRGWGRP
ncbi:MAG: DUF1328 domain-containing protein [Syntrophobacteraceae bacterium]|jgi:uncharacterized membrane protein YtjA (UPF0391 family)